MGKAKKPKLAELGTFSNVFQNIDNKKTQLVDFQNKEVDFRGNWAEKVFKNKKPIVLELACGKGDYTLGLARETPDKNFIGIDIKGARIWRGAKTALTEGITNVAFLRIYIDQLERVFDENEISEIWITFPDPYLKKRQRTKRLTSPVFLARYKKYLSKTGLINLKTDSPELYEYTLGVLDERGIEPKEVIGDIYANGIPPYPLNIQTYYEKKHLEDNRTIRLISFSLLDEQTRK